VAAAVPDAVVRQTLQAMKEMGANFVRLSHYPQHPAFLDACDRLGILVYEEIASWQYIGGEMFTRNAECMMREMIARDKNHPSVILWGLLNEGRSKSLFDRLHNVARECDPTRPTVYADNHPTEGKEKGTVYVPEVLGINYELEHLDEIRAALPDLKFVSSETTNYEHRRRGDVAHDVAQVERYRDETDIVEPRIYMAGKALWSMHDYGTDYELSWPVQHSGAFDGYRLPKGGYWYLRARWSGQPVVRIIGHWNWSRGDVPVLVCTNGESVELFLNGESLGKKPGRFLAKWQVPYASGTLRAVAQCGRTTVEHVLATAGDPAALVVDSSADTLDADGADVAEITVTVVDKDGNPVLTEDGYATFRVEGPGIIRGVAGIPCTAILGGIGRILVQTTSKPGPITVHVAYRGLPEATIMLSSKLP
jgi:beta-galactosidase